MPDYIEVSCPCGRNLRARLDQAGGTIRCWSCRAERRVPFPDVGDRLARGTSDIVRSAGRPESIGAVLLGVLFLAAILTIPVAGPWLGALTLVVGASRYRSLAWGEASADAEDGSESPRWRRISPGRWALAAASAGSLMVPVWLGLRPGIPPWLGSAPISGPLALLGLVGLLTLPTALLIVSAPSPREALASLGRHRLAWLLAALCLPVGLAVIEAALVGLSYEQAWFAFLVSDQFPPTWRRLGLSVERFVYKNPHGFELLNVDLAPKSAFLKVYLDGLRRGYTLLGTVPGSLSVGTSTRLDPVIFGILPIRFLAVRLVFSLVGLTGVGLLVLFQARWLALIGSIDASRPVEPVRPGAPVDGYVLPQDNTPSHLLP